MANEKRLIDANAIDAKIEKTLKKLIANQNRPDLAAAIMTVGEYIDEAPTVDAVEVVRCKDCESHSSNGCPDHRVWCRRLCRFMDSDGFCSDGERREVE